MGKKIKAKKLGASFIPKKGKKINLKPSDKKETTYPPMASSRADVLYSAMTSGKKKK